MPRERIPNTSEPEQRVLFGPMDRHLRSVRERFGVRISVRRGVLLVEGEDAAAVRDVATRVREILERMRGGREPGTEEVAQILLNGRVVEAARSPGSREGGKGRRKPGDKGQGPAPLSHSLEREPSTKVEPKSPGQRRYLDAIRGHDVVLGVGPAGTGKTFLAVVEAVEALRSGSVRKIVLTRPAVEAGEKLGFLPGDFQAKINPYLRPLYDALAELIPWSEVQRLINGDVIEIVPLAYMRGRTMRDSFIILDEAQNTTRAQMKMFLTRMGEGSRIVITGDITQIDLPEGTRSGLVESAQVLRDVAGISVVHFAAEDIVRHPLVQNIVDAYERHESWPERTPPARSPPDQPAPDSDDDAGGPATSDEADA